MFQEENDEIGHRKDFLHFFFENESKKFKLQIFSFKMKINFLIDWSKI